MAAAQATSAADRGRGRVPAVQQDRQEGQAQRLRRRYRQGAVQGDRRPSASSSSSPGTGSSRTWSRASTTSWSARCRSPPSGARRSTSPTPTTTLRPSSSARRTEPLAATPGRAEGAPDRACRKRRRTSSSWCGSWAARPRSSATRPCPRPQADLGAGKVDLVFGDALALSQGFLKTGQGQGIRLRRPRHGLRAAASASASARGSPSWWPASTAPSTQIKAEGTYDKIVDRIFRLSRRPTSRRSSRPSADVRGQRPQNGRRSC